MQKTTRHATRNLPAQQKQLVQWTINEALINSIGLSSYETHLLTVILEAHQDEELAQTIRYLEITLANCQHLYETVDKILAHFEAKQAQQERR